MGNYMPQFNNEKEFEAWNQKQKENIPIVDGIPTFKDTSHFCNVLEKLGFSDAKVKNGNINATFKA